MVHNSIEIQEEKDLEKDFLQQFDHTQFLVIQWLRRLKYLQLMKQAL